VKALLQSENLGRERETPDEKGAVVDRGMDRERNVPGLYSRTQKWRREQDQKGDYRIWALKGGKGEKPGRRGGKAPA